MADTQDVEVVEAVEKFANVGEAICVTYRKDFESALNYEMISGHLKFEPFMAAVKQDVLNNQGLADAFQASPGSAINALLMAAQCKLLPGSGYDLFYLIPRWNGKRKCKEVQPMIGYKGMCELAQRHPRVHKIEAFCVYEGEEFEFRPGEGKLIHKFGLDVDRSDDNLIAAYARVVITDPSGHHPVLDDPVVWVMSRKELEKSRGRSDAWKNAESKGWNSSPWHTDFPMMCRKTVLRAVLTKGSVPKDMGVGGVIQQEDLADVGEKPLPLPKPSKQDGFRQTLGIDKPVHFDLSEEAVAAISAAKTVADLERLRGGWQHLEGVDAETVATAYDDALEGLHDDA
jgi:phage RecT family recombinase